MRRRLRRGAHVQQRRRRPPRNSATESLGCTDCALAPMSVCGKAFAIPPGEVDDATGVRTSFYENVSDAAGVAVMPLDVPTPIDCDLTMRSAVLHVYTTGNRPSIVTVEARDKWADNSGTFGNTVVWVYRDCPTERVRRVRQQTGGKVAVRGSRRVTSPRAQRAGSMSSCPARGARAAATRANAA